MEISLLKVLRSYISLFLHLSSFDDITSEPVQKCYQRWEEMLKLLKPILDAIIDSEIASNEVLNKAFEELAQYVNESREVFESWKILSSEVYFVLQIESLISKIRSSVLDILQLLKSSHELLPGELSSASLEHFLQKIKHMGCGQISSVIKGAIKDQRDFVGPSSEILLKIAESLGLRSYQEILIEVVALEKLKENAKLAEKMTEVEFIDQLIDVVTCMHDRLILIKQSQTCSPVPIPADFCRPLSLELMTDPVVVASGQTYERAIIKKWIDLGLTVCPKTRKILVHTNLIPNYLVKARITNWCKLNNVRMPDYVRSMSLNQPSPLLAQADSAALWDTHIFPHSRSNQPVSPESTQSTGASCKKLMSSSGIHREGTSSLHHHATSEGSLSTIVGNGKGLDIARISLNSSEDRSNSEERSMNQAAQPSISPARKESSNAAGRGQSSQNRNRSASASNTLSNADFPLGAPADANENSEESTHATAYSSDASGEMKSETQVASTLATPRREPKFSPQLVDTQSCSQRIWHQPLERFVPRIFSSPAIETGDDLSGIEAQVRRLVEDLRSPSVDIQREATSELRLRAKHNMNNRIVVANCGAISLLVNLLQSTDTKIQENTVTALLNLSVNYNNKTAIANADAIEPLIHVLETGSPEVKETSAATLLSLSVIEYIKVRIGRSGAIRPLVHLLGNGTPMGKKFAATALFNLSIFHENKAQIVQTGAVRHLVELLDPAAGMVDKAVAVLANLATIPDGRTSIGLEGGIPVLVKVVEVGSAIGKENAAAALLQLCTNSSRFCNMVLQECVVPPLVALSQSGIPRAKEKAQSLLSYFRNQRHAKDLNADKFGGDDLSRIKAEVRRLVEDLKSPSVDTQREATAELRLRVKHNMDNRIAVANCGAISLLVNLLRSTDTKIQENAVTVLLNLSINDNNKTAIANADAIEPLIHVLETGSPEAKENSAATLFSLSVIEDNKVRIGRSGAIKPLVDLLGNGTPRGKKDAATALFNLSLFHENKARIVQAGAVRHLVELIDPAAGMVDKAVVVLSNLATIPDGRTSIGQEGGIPVLVEVVELGSARGKENAAAALLLLCTYSSRFCSMVLQEGAVPPLVALLQSGTPRAKEKAQSLLNYFRHQRRGYAGRG